MAWGTNRPWLESPGSSLTLGYRARQMAPKSEQCGAGTLTRTVAILGLPVPSQCVPGWPAAQRGPPPCPWPPQGPTWKGQALQLAQPGVPSFSHYQDRCIALQPLDPQSLAPVGAELQPDRHSPGDTTTSPLPFWPGPAPSSWEFWQGGEAVLLERLGLHGREVGVRRGGRSAVPASLSQALL